MSLKGKSQIKSVTIFPCHKLTNVDGNRSRGPNGSHLHSVFCTAAKKAARIVLAASAKNFPSYHLNFRLDLFYL